MAEKPAADFAFSTSEEMNPWVELDLGRDVSVTGVRVPTALEPVKPVKTAL